MTNIVTNCRGREEGKLSQYEMRQRITEMRMRPTSRTPRLWSGESEANVREIPRVLFFDELSRRDSKGFNSQDCEVGSKSTFRVLTSLVDTTLARMILTMVVVFRISSLVRE